MGHETRSRDRNALQSALPTALLLGMTTLALPAGAQMGPLRQNGFVEYQYRMDDSRDAATNGQQLVTWRGNFDSYLWRPWILQLDGNLGLTRSYNTRGDARQDGNLVTGGLVANLFPRSHFPFRAYFESRDSRVDGDLSDLDLATTTFGFLQQYASRDGGRYSIDFRQSDNDELYEDGFRVRRNYTSRNWQLNASRALGRHDLRLLTQLKDVERDEPMQMEDRTLVNLRHRFRTSPRFFIEDTTFFSSERVEFQNSDLRRRFLQWNGISTWRPATERPMYVTIRGLAQGVDSGSYGDETGSTLMILNGAATYQFSENVTLAGNLGVTATSMDQGDDETTVSQRLRGVYRSDVADLWRSDYRWGGTLEGGNRRDRVDDGNAVQDIVLGLDHSLSRNLVLRGQRQLQFSFSQQATSAFDTMDRRDYTLTNSFYTTLNRQNGRTSSYLRMALSDRRSFGDEDEAFQLANLQASMRTQLDRSRSINGSITLQYVRSDRSDPAVMVEDNRSMNYSANLDFVKRDLFDVPQLNFSSELRWISTDFRSDDPLDRPVGADPDRDDRIWRNRLDYRIGRLELRLNADVRQINDVWMSQIFLQVRRYYGDL